MTQLALDGLPDQPVFVGRDTELRRLAETLRPGGRPVVTTIEGLGGVGKTALALEAATTAACAGWFPGGVVMADIQAYEQAGEDTVASAVVAGLLDATGTAAEHIPPGLEDRTRRWRSVLAKRAPMLIIVDNAAGPEQVRPVLPGASSHGRHRVLVTSRHSFAALQGTQCVELGVLTVDEAVALLEANLEAACAEHGRVRAFPEAARQVAELCGHLPLALQIGSAMLRQDPHLSLVELAELLRCETDRLDELNFGGVPAVRATFDVSYRKLAAEEARGFRLLSVNPGPVVGTGAFAALAYLPVRTAGRVLRELARAHLVSSVGASRWRMHDLVRLYAAELTQPKETEAAGERLVRHYLRMTKAAERHLDLQGKAIPDETFSDRRTALAWLDAERANLVGATTLADNADAVDLAATLHCYLELRHHWQDGIATAKVALSGARRLRDRQAEWIALSHLGHAHRDGHNYDQAFECHLQALEICRETGNRGAEAHNLSALGNACAALGRIEDAIAHNEESLRIRRVLGDRYGQRLTLNHLGNAYRLAGRGQDAIDCYLESLRLWGEMGDPLGNGRTLTNLGAAYHDQGRLTEAIDCYVRDLDIARKLEDRPAEAFTLTKLGHVHRESDQHDQARDCYQRALEISKELVDTRATLDLLLELDRLDGTVSPLVWGEGVTRGTAGYSGGADCGSPCYEVVREYHDG